LIKPFPCADAAFRHFATACPNSEISTVKSVNGNLMPREKELLPLQEMQDDRDFVMFPAFNETRY
jgi:hypothetical protein